jgi:hypothetical protein
MRQTDTNQQKIQTFSHVTDHPAFRKAVGDSESRRLVLSFSGFIAL